jgi:type IV secretory pathway VirB9-like protein
MTKDDVIKTAQEAYRTYMDWADRDDPWRREHGSKYYEDEAIKKAAIAAAAAEREQCAKAVEAEAYMFETLAAAKSCAATIRARSQA